MRILIACEESQAICIAFRNKGHEAYSCDLQKCSGGHPEYHIIADVMTVINGGWVTTQAGARVYIDKWELMIGHPECKFLCWSGERWIKNNPERLAKRMEAFEFLKTLYNCQIEKVCIENSLSLWLERNWKKPTQTVHPFHFGDPYRKSTCLWIRGLKPLIPTNIIWQRYPAAHKEGPSSERSKIRAKTYPGIALAMAEQWG